MSFYKLPVLIVASLIAICGHTFVTFAEPVDESKASTNTQTETKGKVLRHAVFFKFNDGTSDAQVSEVLDAFRALPATIKEIRAFQLGKNINKKNMTDGLTHCFLLTFDNEKGREAYLPHPAHQEFGRLLRPHLDKVFVIDYWGRAQKQPTEKALLHAVFFKFKAGTTDEAVREVEDDLAALPAKIDTIKGFEWGTNNSPEKHDQEFTHCFMFTFNSEEGLKQYADHPDHVTAAKALLPKVESVRVMDFWAEDVPKIK